jgi:UDP:flavonoid glycosyltransferase YjiC (YdhE family)
MARFLVAALPFFGHFTPMLPIARTLVERGHDVRFYTGEKFRPKAEAAGVPFVPIEAGIDFDDENLGARFPELPGLDGIAGLKYYVKHVFGDSGPGQVEDWRRILQDFSADVIFTETTVFGARWIHELGGPPWAVLNPIPLTLSSDDLPPFGLGLAPRRTFAGGIRDRTLKFLVERVLMRDTISHIDGHRRSLGLEPTNIMAGDAVLSPYLYMQSTIPSFEYPRSSLPPQVHFIGPILPIGVPDFDPPSWWGDLLDSRPVVHVTQGTLATMASDLLVPTVRALADEDVLVVATTGGKSVESLGIGDLPDNARVETFIPHAHLLPHVDVMITNGGYNGVHMALRHGVPLIGAGKTEDKPEVCARIAWSGVGINLKTAKPSERKIRDAVRTILGNSDFRTRARELASEIQQTDAPLEAALLLEQLAETGKPVTKRKRKTEPMFTSSGDAASGLN